MLINYQSNDKEAANTLQLVREQGGDGELLKFDVSSPAAVSEALNTWSAQHPDEYIEVLINNAGIRKDNLMLWMTEPEWNGVLNTSLNGFFYVTQALLKNMLVKRFGRIVNIVSLSGIKGMPGQDKPYISPPKKQKIFVNQIAVGTCWQYQLGVDSGKEIIMDNLRVQTPGQKYCHFPKRDDYGSAYFAGLLSETKVYDPNKKQPWSWKKIPGHERNEPLDCRNYALAAFKALPKNLDEIDRQIKAASGVRVPAPPSANITPPKRRPAQRSRQKYYDDW